MRWNDLTKEQQDALFSFERGSGRMLTMEIVSQLIDLGLVEARTGGAALSKRAAVSYLSDDGSMRRKAEARYPKASCPGALRT